MYALTTLGIFVGLATLCFLSDNCVSNSATSFVFNTFSKLVSDVFDSPESWVEMVNDSLQNKSAQEIIQWSLTNSSGLYQTTAFGLSGLVILDMISKLHSNTHPIDLIFIDTLHHFQETLDLVDRVQEKYSNVKVHVYKPANVNDCNEFAQRFGEKLWETDDILYDYLAKVEPAQRAYTELGAKAVLTGRRRTQGGARAMLLPVEYDNACGLIKINPLYNWTFGQVKQYIDDNNVPYNVLLDKGYRSVGDFHSTVPVKEGEDERSGRWKGKSKSECGIHQVSKFAKFVKAKRLVSPAK